ncbi:4Fe-4S binding protein [Candidatus Bathyarchaeota archaeon]|nr:4Fe-4S binding protein [Candidatus Bathyarchaeota archaeon]
MSGLLRRLMGRFGRGVFEPEDRLSKLEGAIGALADAPARFDFIGPESSGEMSFPVSLSAIPSMLRIMGPMRENMNLASTSVDENPVEPKVEVDEPTLEELRGYARSLGLGELGYTKLPRKLIFKEKAVLYDNVIVLSMEMDRAKIEKAPSTETRIMILETYNELGIAANRITEFLRERGYGAQAGHPLGGVTIYPPLGELAGMGWHGRHGMLITPEYGPRHRLAAVYTSIGNLPLSDMNSHAWIGEFCKTCGRCIEACPSGAILDTPVSHENGVVTHIERDLCFPVFLRQHGCSICIKECTFNRTSYESLRSNWEG